MVLKKITNYLDINNYNLNLTTSDFVMEVSNIYHSIESKDYDDLHQSMFKESSIYWKKIILKNYNLFDDNLTVIDYGCGTGFAIDKILKSPLKSKIKKIICYDLSSHMVNECKKNILVNHSDVSNIDFTFLSGNSGYKKIELLEYDLIISNALLHHLLDLKLFFNFINSNLKPNGIYIAGHEPNKNFYFNRVLLKFTKKFQKYKKLKLIINPLYILRKLKIINFSSKNIIAETNKILLNKKLMNKELPSNIMPKLVDIHVPIGLSRDQIWGELGFNPDLILSRYLINFKLIDMRTYFHIKDYKVFDSIYYRYLNKLLMKKYPKDGADCIMLFKKK